MTVVPRQQTPPLSIETVAGQTFDLSQQQPQNFTVLVFYRGHH